MKMFTERIDQEKRLCLLFLLLALIVNGLILFVLFLITIEPSMLDMRHHQDPPAAPIVFEDFQEQQPPPPPPEPETMLSDVAALKPGASNFGMPDEFKEDEMVAIPTTTDDDLNEPSNGYNIENDYQEQEALPESQQEENRAQEQQSQQKQEEPETEKNSAIPEESVQKALLEEVKEPNIQPLQQKDHVERPEPLKKMPQARSKQKPIIKAPLEKKLTFNDLAQGFLSSLDEGGHDLMERKGNENIRPDFEEMRYLSYLHKIVWYMQNEWRRDNSIVGIGIPAMVVTGVSVTVDKNGNLKNAFIAQSCGDQRLDDAILRGIKSASPYPPLPAHLKKDILTVEFGVKHIPYSYGASRYK